MDEATKAKLKEAGLETVITAYEKLESDIVIKDGVIEQKNKDLVGLRTSSEEKYKKLSEMTEAEKASMSEKEIELQKRQEKFDEDMRLFKENQAATQKKEVDARWERAATKIAGGNAELKQKILENKGKIVDSDKAQTDEEIAAVAGSAFNMLGVPKLDGIREAINGGNGDSGVEVKTGEFADTAAGKSLAGAMNLPVETPKA